jgi:hypothetical protein
MANVCEISAYMGRRGMTKAQVARNIGMKPDSFRRKMRIGKFLDTEAALIIKCLEIPEREAYQIFFGSN